MNSESLIQGDICYDDDAHGLPTGQKSVRTVLVLGMGLFRQDTLRRRIITARQTRE